MAQNADSVDSPTQRETCASVGVQAGEEKYTDPKATVWLKPKQVSAMRDGAVATSAGYLAGRNNAILALLYDTGLRVGELVALNVEMLDLNEGVLMLPASIQKDYPNNNNPTVYRDRTRQRGRSDATDVSQLTLEGQPRVVPLATGRTNDHRIGAERRPIGRGGRRRPAIHHRGARACQAGDAAHAAS